MEVVLVEAGPLVKGLDGVARWENPRRKRWKEIDRAHSMGKQLHIQISSHPPVDGPTLAQIMHTMSEKYGIEWGDDSQIKDPIWMITASRHGGI